MITKAAPAKIPPENYENRTEYLDAVFEAIDMEYCENTTGAWTQEKVNCYMDAEEIADYYY